MSYGKGLSNVHPKKTSAVREVSSVDIFGQGKGRFFGRGRSHVLVQKRSDFLKFRVCLHGKGERVNFSRFCADVFYGPPLNKAADFEVERKNTAELCKSLRHIVRVKS